MKTIKKLGGVNTALVQTQSKKNTQRLNDLRERVLLAVKMTSADEWPMYFELLGDRDGIINEDEENELLSLIEPWLAVSSSLKGIDLYAILLASFSPHQLSRLDLGYPIEIEAPDGAKIPILYSGGVPVAHAKLQQFFGAKESPCIGPEHNRIPISISLLSTSGKPLAQTLDLPYFWNEVYPSVRSEMRGRYPKHPWPEDPMSAVPTRLSKKQQGSLEGSAATGSEEERMDARKVRRRRRRRGK